MAVRLLTYHGYDYLLTMAMLTVLGLGLGLGLGSGLGFVRRLSSGRQSLGAWSAISLPG
jgi:hypothetical protein